MYFLFFTRVSYRSLSILLIGAQNYMVNTNSAHKPHDTAVQIKCTALYISEGYEEDLQVCQH